MKKILLISSILVFVTSVFAGPKYDAVYHLISKSYTLNEDGGVDFHFRKELQLFTYPAFDKYGETFILYNTEWQTLTINEAYTIRKDGSKVQTPANAFNPMLPSGCAQCERFNTMREMVVTHTALEYEATIVLDYTIHSEQPFFKELMEQVDLYEDAPIDQYEVTLKCPESHQLSSMENSFSGKHSMEDSSWSVAGSYWKFNYYNIPQKPSDAYLPDDYLPTLTFSMRLADKGKEETDFKTSFYRKFKCQNAFLDAPNDLLENVLNDILKDKKTDMEKVLAIRDYVADNIHTNELPLRYLNYIVASPSTVWKTNCATPFEKNLLFCAMLKAAGLTAQLGVLENGLVKDPEGVVLFRDGEKNYFLTAAYKHQKNLSKTSGSATAFMNDAAYLYLDFVNKVDLNIEANVAVSRTGEGLSATVTTKRAAGSTYDDLYLLPNSGKSVSASIQPLSGNFYRLWLKDSPDGCPLRSVNIRSGRTHPVELPLTEESYHYTVMLPIDVDCISSSEMLEKTYDFGSVRIERQVKGDTVYVTRQLHLNPCVLKDKKRIRQLRELLGEWNQERPLMLTKNNRVHEINVIYGM